MVGASFSHYRVVRKLGEGGMGEVFLAEDLRLERHVALKFLPVHIASDPHALARFDREAKAAAAVSHPNIITVHEIGVSEGKPYIAMAYVEGHSLSEVLRERRLSVGKSVDIVSQACEGLAEAHRNGVIHRDIKPANLHIDHSGRVRILDFGLALRSHLTKITQEQVAVGTVEYMSPEQATGGRVDERSDIFSLGTLLYELLAGKMPFEGPHTAAVIFAITTLEPTPLRQLNPAVSPALASVVERALQKDPAQRYASAAEMAAALRAAGGSEARIERIKRRHRRTAIRTGLALALALALFTGWKLYPRSGESIAVLPFANISDEPEQQYFVDGMTEAITTRLAQIDKLVVISRTSAMHFQKTDKTIREIGRELDVGWIVEGSVTRYGNQVRITAQLIDAKKDQHLWAQEYKANDVTDLMDVQSRIAAEIARQVSVHVKPEDQARIDAVQTRHAEALDVYLQGRERFNRRMPADITAALDYFNQAIAIDSTFAQAFAGIADCYTVRAMWNWDTSQNTFPRARYASERALQIDPMLAEAHASRAMVQLYYDWDWKAAEVSFKTAIGLNPNYATAYHWYGLALMSLGRYGDARDKLERAVRLDP
ncbi:MAG TPA: protein kinase, partial [Candidatus Krumholzibacteria bacterium]